jgi:hypothetical protein
MKRFIPLCLMLGCLSFPPVYAADNDDSSPEAESIEAALDDCAASVAADSGGQPDAQAMDECMSGKGYSRPMGAAPNGHGGDNGSGGQGGRPPPPPPRN